MGRLSNLESHLATLSALPDLAQASDYLSALSISNRPIQVAMGYQNQVCLRENASVLSKFKCYVCESVQARAIAAILEGTFARLGVFCRICVWHCLHIESAITWCH